MSVHGDAEGNTMTSQEHEAPGHSGIPKFVGIAGTAALAAGLLLSGIAGIIAIIYGVAMIIAAGITFFMLRSPAAGDGHQQQQAISPGSPAPLSRAPAHREEATPGTHGPGCSCGISQHRKGTRP
jgi:hypothetical protein